MKLEINGQTEEAKLERDGTNLVGYTTRNGEEVDQNIKLENIKFAVENNYIDELELLLASLDITVGTEIDDSIFMPQSLISSPMYGIVEDFKNVQLYNQVFDSCFRIEFTYPTMMTVYFTPDKRLVKLVVPSQELKIYQDAVTNPLKAKQSVNKSATQNSAPPQRKNLPLTILLVMALIYFVSGGLITILFIKKLYKNVVSYLALLVGSVIFIVIPFTQIPLQEYFFRDFYVPHVLQGGESALLWGILPAISAGLIQELLILITLILFFKFLKVKDNYYLPLGAIIGFGFGFIESVFLANGTPALILFGTNLVERIFLIMFHVSSGVFISYALKQNMQKAFQFVVVTIIINSFLRYLPVFVQNKIVTPELMAIGLAFISILFLTYNIYLSNKKI